jgi:SAM-dependent methyltransferase
LAQAGIVAKAHCIDISAGMVAQCVANGRRLGIDVVGEVADAEALPHDDASFDLVVGHAVIHHLPDPPAAFAEFRRVLKPGGRLVIAGEPTATGDRIAGVVKSAARMTVKLAAAVAGAERILADPLRDVAPADRAAAALETAVDLHTFAPHEVEALAGGAGFSQVHTVTEELTANWFGWFTRTVEAMVRPGVLPDRYPWWAYQTWRRLFAFDETIATRVVPKPVFYNCVLGAVA